MAENPSDPFTIFILESFQKMTFWDTNHGLLFLPFMGENLKEKENGIYGLCSTLSI